MCKQIKIDLHMLMISVIYQDYFNAGCWDVGSIPQKEKI